MRRISVIGMGYIGLPTAVLAAKSGFEVFGFDIDQEKIRNINEGKATIAEPGMKDHLCNVLSNGTFKAFKDIQYADCFVITVQTPIKENKHADLSYDFSASESVAKRLMPGNLVILESTVPVGTTERVANILEEYSGLKAGVDFFVSHCPERVIPGRIFKELVDNDRVIGGMCHKACELSRNFYSKFVKGFLHITDDKTAEMVKLVENSCRDVQIAFANQVAAMAMDAGINPFQVIEFANKHPRVKILSPGTGVGGHCVAVDPYFLIQSFPQETALLQTARQVNNEKPYQILDKILSRIQRLKAHGIEKPKICILGLTFKPNVDDIRESPALKIALELNRQKESFDLCIFDPNISTEILHKLGLTTKHDLIQQVQASDLVAILVKHKEFEGLPESIFDNKILIDPCGLLYDMQIKKSKELLNGSTQLKQMFKQQFGI
jgi:UDP-N-acetyl-D-mannosaminuronic acid dehydrogenase